MPVLNSISAMHEEITAWRRDLHEHPELGFEVHRTAGIVAEKLRAFGCDEVVSGIGRTGVVGVIRGRKTGSGRVIGLRADLDALPIHEQSGAPYASKTPGVMHACGHDGHTAMLLGAAKYLSETRNFDGTAIVIFQPAEESGGGGREMVQAGMMDRFGVQEVYGLHNSPELPVGAFATRPGPIMAAYDHIAIKIQGKGGHGARPHASIDSVLAGAHIVTALQSIAARNVDPLESCVVSICTFHAGTASNVIPDTAELTGTARSLEPHIRDMLEKRVGEIAALTAQALGATATTTYTRGYPVTRNHERQTAFAVGIAAQIVGTDQVNAAMPPVMGAEDFSYMLEARPGAFIMMGIGQGGAGLHHPAYNFNDEAIPVGVSYWAKLVETGMPA